MLKWFEQTLYEMEANGEIAIVLGHHPPGCNACLDQWSKRYQAISDRFQNVIRFSLFGHVHKEMHNVIKSQSGKSIGINIWTGATTPYSDLPAYPNFRRIIVDAETMLPIKLESWAIDIEQENPEFYLHHEFTEYYGMKDLSPESFDWLSMQFLENEQMAVKYRQTMNMMSPYNVPNTCDEKCRLEVYCQTQHSVYWDQKACEGMVEKQLRTDPGNWLAETIMDPWYTHSRFPNKGPKTPTFNEI
jgi:hypothetical protein